MSMMKFLPAFALLLIAGCQTPPPAPKLPEPVGANRPAAVSVTNGFDWSWDIAGDPQVRPIQVFSNAEKTWLQMKPYQVMPALFVDGQPVPFASNPPYLIVPGTPSKIDVVATSYRAVITRRVTAPVVPPQRTVDVNRITRVPANQIPQE